MKALLVICVAAVFHSIFVASRDNKDCDEVSMNRTTTFFFQNSFSRNYSSTIEQSSSMKLSSDCIFSYIIVIFSDVEVALA